MTALQGITKRWARNSLGYIISVLCITIFFAVIAVRAYYYNSVEQILISQANSVSAYFDVLTNEQDYDYYSMARRIVMDYATNSKAELMILDDQGRTVISSSGFYSKEEAPTQDFRKAVESVGSTGQWVGRLPETREKVMSIATLLFDGNGRRIGAVRYISSMSQVDTQLIFVSIFIALMGLIALVLVFMSGSYFIGTIVVPVREIGVTAKKIASGNYNIRIEKKYDDEIGDLGDTINYMANELVITDQMKNEFLSSVSHELRTPLTAIKGWGETMLSDLGNQETIKKGLNVILGETDRLSNMVEELLDFSRVQNGKFALVMDKTDILAELEEAILIYSEKARIEGIIFDYEEPQDFPYVIADHNRIKQVFVNIIDNAVKYCDRGDRIVIRAFYEANNVQVTITDTGSGISAEDLVRVKEKFYKGNTTRRGSGIGLALADEIIKLHGGILDIFSEENVGTTVSIAIPRSSSVETGRDKS